MSLFPLAPWQVWTLAALLLFIGEILTPGFVLACFALACLVPACRHLVHPLGFQAQMGLFALSSLAVYVLLRPAVVRYLSSRESRIPSNAESLIGAAGRVVKEVPRRRQRRLREGGRQGVGGLFIPKGRPFPSERPSSSPPSAEPASRSVPRPKRERKN